MKNLGALIEKVTTDESPVTKRQHTAPDNNFWVDYGSLLGKTLLSLPPKVAMRIRHQIENTIYHETQFSEAY